MAGEKQAAAEAALFAKKHEELLAEAAAVASDLGVDVETYVSSPDGTGVAKHVFLGRPPTAAATVRSLLAKDVSRMGPAEVKAHKARLLALRAAVTREMQTKKTADGAGAGDDGRN